ncbi:hypothetical protein ACWE42_10245 [Sutcliffiella cohnii]
MRKDLNNLKSILNNTIYENTHFSESSKNKVRKRIDGNQSVKFYYKMKPIVSFIVLFSITASLVTFTFNMMNNKDVVEHENSALIKSNGSSNSDAKDVDANINTSKEIKENIVAHNAIKSYPYIIFNNYYYKKTDEEITEDQLGEIMGEVKRIGDWNFKKDGDSNEIPPGRSIYSVKDKDKNEYIAAKGVVYKNQTNIPGYLLFKKEEPVIHPDQSLILNAKSDPEETEMAFKNMQRLVPNILGLQELEQQYTLSFVSYLEEHGPGVNLYYSDNSDTNNVIYLLEYKNGLFPHNSRMVENPDPRNPWEPPVLSETFELNGFNWEYYEDKYYDDFFLLGEKNGYIYEVTFQGEFSLDDLKDIVMQLK